MTAKELRRLGLGLLIGAAVAFPTGLILGRLDSASATTARSGAAPRVQGEINGGRRVFSPHILNDPYVLEQQRKVVEELEFECRHSGLDCAKATKARTWLHEHN